MVNTGPPRPAGSVSRDPGANGGARRGSPRSRCWTDVAPKPLGPWVHGGWGAGSRGSAQPERTDRTAAVTPGLRGSHIGMGDETGEAQGLPEVPGREMGLPRASKQGCV